MERIVIVINKSWEADAALAAMFNPEFKSDKKGFPKKYADWYGETKVIQEMGYPIDETKNHKDIPRVVYTKGNNLQVEVWCLNNVMTKNPDPKDEFYYSRTWQKVLDFPKILNYSSDPIKLLVAFGTAGLPSELSKNGGVVVGSSAFAFDFFGNLNEEEKSKRVIRDRYKSDKFGKIIKSSIDQFFFDSLNLAMADASLRIYFEGAALSTPNNPASLFTFMADKNLVAISDMNTDDYADFKEGDKRALASFKVERTKAGDAFKNQIPMSIETTHSIMRLESTTDNFIFITAITDRVAYFESEVSSRELAQNFSASFNGGIFLNWFVPFCFDYFSTLDKPVA